MILGDLQIWINGGVIKKPESATYGPQKQI
jgi:hypothetical protein